VRRLGFTVLAFPSNQFGSQEPWEEQKIKQHVTKEYGVTFPLFGKVSGGFWECSWYSGSATTNC